MKKAKLIGLSVAVLLSSFATVRVEAEGRRYAFIVGVENYVDGQGLNQLQYAENDATDLAKVLEASGYTVVLMTDSRARQPNLGTFAPTGQFIRVRLKQVLDNPNLTDEDTVLVAFSGHGIQLPREQETDGQKSSEPQYFFCPSDTLLRKGTFLDEDLKRANDVEDRHHLIALDEIYQQLEASKAGTKLLFVDACRNDPVSSRSASKTLPKLPPPPGGIVAFFSCSPNEKAFESDDLQHGVFFHQVIQALKGDAETSSRVRKADGKITLSELSLFVAPSVRDYLTQNASKFSGMIQQPELTGTIRDEIVIIPKLGPPQSFTNSIGMKFNLIPEGEFQMGSPEDEKGRDDDEHQHRVRISKPYYLGVYEVTQSEYERVMGENPSAHRWGGIYAKDVVGLDTSRFPVEQVSWEDAQEFISKLNALEKGTGRKYRLPTEAEWEHACRAGTTTPFSFGKSCNETEANINGNDAYGTSQEGPSLVRPTEVGSYAANAFGLYDLHGNVCEWCQDWYDEDYYRSSPRTDPQGSPSGSSRCLRGGSFYYNAKARSFVGSQQPRAVEPFLRLRFSCVLFV